MSEWKKINTAPKDGTSVLVYFCEIKGWNEGVVEASFQDGYWEDVAGAFHDDAPTHWMPLPEPPK